MTIVKDRCFGGAKDKAILPPHLESIFIHAIAENDVESVKKFLDADFGNKGLNEYLRTPLHIAAKYGCLETMEVLIQSGANIQEKDIYKQAPIHFAAKHGSLNCLKCLIEKQANVPFCDVNESLVIQIFQIAIQSSFCSIIKPSFLLPLSCKRLFCAIIMPSQLSHRDIKPLHIQWPHFLQVSEDLHVIEIFEEQEIMGTFLKVKHMSLSK